MKGVFTMALEMNKRYTWDEIVKAYPDRYVIYNNAERCHLELVSCVLLNVCTYEDRDSALKAAIEKYNGDVDIMCTTEGDPFFNGVIFW